MHPPRDAAQAFCPVVHGVHRRHHGQQHLRRADVRRRLFAPDVLLARLQGQAVGRAVLGVDRQPDQASRQVALEPCLDRHEGGVRASVPERHAEALGRADDDVGAPLPRRPQQRERQQVGSHRHQGPAPVGLRCHGGEVADGTRRAGILLHHPEEVPARQPGLEVRHFDVDPERRQPRGQHGQRLRQAVGVDHDPVGLARRSPAHQSDRLGYRRAFVQQRSVRRVQPGQVRHHGLEVQQRLQSTLADLGLVRRVGRVPGRALEHVAPDHTRRDRPVVAQTDHGLGDHVAPGQPAQLLEHRLLGSRRRQIECLQGAHTPGHGGVDQCIERVVAEHLEHALLLLGRGADMASDEVLERLERGSAVWLCRRMGCAHGGLLVGSAFTRSHRSSSPLCRGT